MKITHELSKTPLDVLTLPADPAKNCVPQNLGKRFQRRDGAVGGAGAIAAGGAGADLPSVVFLIAYGPHVCVVQSTSAAAADAAVVTYRIQSQKFEQEWMVVPCSQNS